MRSLLVSAVFGSLLAIAGCQASVEAEVKTGGSDKDQVPDFDKPIEPTSQGAAPVDDSPREVGPLGARQDLSFKGPATGACSCLAVALGQAGDPTFAWAGGAPQTDPASQLVVALSSAGVACAASGASGASYWGYEVDGNDVVVVVESARPGRPQTSGAIIPRPLGDGQVYVRPSEKGVPYGRPATGKGERCQVSHLAPVARAAAPAPSPTSGVRIRTEESDPTSSKTDLAR